MANLTPEQEMEIRLDFDTLNSLIPLLDNPSEFMKNPFWRGAFIDIIICLRDLDAKADKYFDAGLVLSDAGTIASGVNNIGHLLRECRNTFCHIDDSDNYVNTNRLSSNIIQGLSNAIDINGKTIPGVFADDYCLNMGQYLLYYKHHILVAQEHYKKVFAEVITPPKPQR